MKNKFLKGLIASFALAVSCIANAGLIEVNPGAGGGCCNFGERGYWFETPEELTFTSFWLNTSAGLSTNYNLDIILLNNTPPAFPGSTSGYVTLGTWDALSGILNTNITVAKNSFIGLLAWDVNLSLTPYSTAFSQNINGESVIFTRLLRQSLTNGDPVSSSTGSSIGAIGFTANTAEVPEPSTLAVLALGLMGLASRKFKKQA